MFGANARPERTAWQTAPAAVCASGALVMAVTAALVTAAELRGMRPARRTAAPAGPQVRQSDLWRIRADGVIAGRSRLEFERWPERRDSLGLALGYTEARPLRATIADQPAVLRSVGAGTFELAWPAPPPVAPRTVEVFWELPLAALEAPEQGFRARLQAMLPVHGYSLTVALAPEGVYRFENAGDRREETVFSQASTGQTPRNQFGSCGLALRKTAGGPAESAP